MRMFLVSALFICGPSKQNEAMQGMISRFIAAFVITGSLMSAKAQPTTRPSIPLIAGHRGASFDAPENTLASFKLALEQNADALESDFYLTADGKVISLHDATFKRTGGVDRKPIELTVDEIRKIDVGSWKDPRFAGERAPLLSEILAILPKGKLFLMEIKCGPEILPAFKKAIEDSGVPIEQLRLICFNAEVIAEAKKLMPQLKAYWLTSFKAAEGETQKHPTLEEILTTLKQIKADGLDAQASMDVVTADLIQAIKKEGYEAHFWTVDDPAIATKLAEIGADSITTNRPGMIRQALTEHSR